MGQFVFGLLAGIIVGLVMEWVIDWTGLFPNRAIDKKKPSKAAQDMAVIPVRPRTKTLSVKDVASMQTNPDRSGE